MRHIPIEAIEDAARHVYEAAVRTPLIKLDLPFADDGVVRPEIYLKLESLQPIGSFKIRGAWNAVRKLTGRLWRDLQAARSTHTHTEPEPGSRPRP